jgi:tetratricopeptide (TPR) repeat protein
VLALAVLLTCAASPALAQSIVRGKVVDAKGQAIEGAVITFERTSVNQKTETKTDENGDFLQVGLGSDEYRITAAKEGVGTATQSMRVSQGQNEPLSFTLAPAAAPSSGITAENKAEAAALQALASQAIEALKAGDNDAAIASFTQVVTKVPTCADCYMSLATAYTNKRDYAGAEAAYKRVIELMPESGDAYTGLANIYNAQKKFDLAADASASAAKYSGGAAGAGGGSAEALYNQAVIQWNSGNFAAAKEQFEAAAKADPAMAMAHYQLGMANLNLGEIPAARAAFEAYLKVEPTGEKAAEVQTFLKQLPQ